MRHWLLERVRTHCTLQATGSGPLVGSCSATKEHAAPDPYVRDRFVSDEQHVVLVSDYRAAIPPFRFLATELGMVGRSDRCVVVYWPVLVRHCLASCSLRGAAHKRVVETRQPVSCKLVGTQRSKFYWYYHRRMAVASGRCLRAAIMNFERTTRHGKADRATFLIRPLSVSAGPCRLRRH